MIGQASSARTRSARSRRAAERLGFRFEGVFRQATIYKGRNRDTAWYSVLDTEWPAVKAAFDGTGPTLIDVTVDPSGYGEQLESLRG